METANRTRKRWIPALMAGILLLSCQDSVAPLAPGDPAPDLGRFANLDSSLLLEGVQLRPGVTVDIHVREYLNEARPCRGGAVSGLAIHGVTANAQNWQPFAEALFDRGAAPVCRLYAVDLPGHGESGLPEGSLLFGDLLIDDYVTTVLAVLDHLRGQGVRPGVLFGHSLGTLVTMMTQQRLLDRGASLFDEYRVRHVVLLGPVPSAEVPWSMAGLAATTLPNFIDFSPELGVHAAATSEEWVFLWFSNPGGVLATTAPTPAEVADNGWNDLEPLVALSQLIGIPPLEEPSIQAGAFSPGTGTTAQVVNFADDIWSIVPDDVAIYRHLTGDMTNAGFVSVTSDLAGNAVHGMYASEPQRVVSEVCAVACRGRLGL